MLVEGEGSPQMITIHLGTLASWVPYGDLDSFRGHLLVWSPIVISILLGNICSLVSTFSACCSFLYGISHLNDYPILNSKHNHF